MSKTKITVNNNGSLKVEGDFEVVDKTAQCIICKAEKLFRFAAAACRRTNRFVMVHTKGILNTKRLLLIFRQRKQYNIKIEKLPQ